MKVVLFCGGLGTRLWDYSQDVPKPMVRIGYRPIMWHLMKYYAHFGHTEFILCLGYKADVVKEYFLNYNEGISNDFVLSDGGRTMELLTSDIDDWRITFVDTGIETSIGQRLYQVREHLESEDVFLCNYSDGLTDAPLPEIIDFHNSSDVDMTMMATKPTSTFHVLKGTSSGLVRGVEHIAESDTWINGGFYVMSPSVFDYLDRGEDLLEGPIARMADRERVAAYRYAGFWTAMDTFKDKARLEDVYAAGTAPWEVWKNPSGGPALRPVPTPDGVTTPIPAVDSADIQTTGTPDAATSDTGTA